jgi:hypothetical protein
VTGVVKDFRVVKYDTSRAEVSWTAVYIEIHALAAVHILFPPHDFALYPAAPPINRPLTSSQGVRALFHRRAEPARK